MIRLSPSRKAGSRDVHDLFYNRSYIYSDSMIVLKFCKTLQNFALVILGWAEKIKVIFSQGKWAKEREKIIKSETEGAGRY